MPNCQPRIPLFLHQYLNFIICSHVSPKRNDSAISIFWKILKELANSQRSTWREKMIHHVIILSRYLEKSSDQCTVIINHVKKPTQSRSRSKEYRNKTFPWLLKIYHNILRVRISNDINLALSSSSSSSSDN